MNLESCPVNIGEVWGAFYGLELAWNKRFHLIQLELDSTSAIALISGSANLLHPYATVIQSVRDLIYRPWTVKIMHVFGEGNKAADALAALGHPQHLGVIFYSSPPLSIGTILREDLVGVAMSHALV